MGLHTIDWKNRHATTGTFIGEEQWRGKCFGTHAKMLLLRWAFDELGLNKIESRAIYHYFEEYLIFDPAVKHFTVKLKSLDLPRPFLRGFLRGYIDTDGSILRDKRCNSLIVMFFTTSEVMAQQIERILGALHIEITTWCLRRTRYKPLYYNRVRVRAVKAFLHLVHPFKMRYLPARAHMRT